jgi:hypothetical protein
MVRYLLNPFKAGLTSISRGLQWVHVAKVFVEAFLHLPIFDQRFWPGTIVIVCLPCHRR